MQHDSDSPLGQAGLILLEKDVTNVIFYIRISQIQRPEDYATGASTLGVLYAVHPLARLSARDFCRYNIARRGLSRVAYPNTWAMREPARGISEK